MLNEKFPLLLLLHKKAQHDFSSCLNSLECSAYESHLLRVPPVHGRKREHMWCGHVTISGIEVRV